VAAEDKALYARMCIAGARSGLLPHAIARAVKYYLAETDRDRLALLTPEEAAEEAILLHGAEVSVSPSPPSGAAARRSRSASPARAKLELTLAQSARRAAVAAEYASPVSPLRRPRSKSPVKAHLDPEDIRVVPGSGTFRMPPAAKLKHASPEKGLWADMVKRDTHLAGVEAEAERRRRAALQAAANGELDEQRDARMAEKIRERLEKQWAADRTVRANKEAARQTRAEAAEKAARRAQVVAETEAFNASEQAKKAAARKAEVEAERAAVAGARAKQLAADRADAAKKKAKRDEIAAFMRQNEVELAQKAMQQERDKAEAARQAQEAIAAADAREEARLADLQGKLDAMKKKMNAMSDFMAAKDGEERRGEGGLVLVV
jgi:hypothetical protein